MLKVKGVFISTTFVLCLFLGFSAQATSKNDQLAVANAYQGWCDTIANGKVDAVIKFYAPEAILLPTLSPKILVNKQDGLKDYFVPFVSHPNIKCTTNKLITNVYGDTAINTGLYTFTYTDSNNHTKTVPARFTFVYKKTTGSWLIINHHSSKLP